MDEFKTVDIGPEDGERARHGEKITDLPRQIGNYLLLRVIGEGGMGQVFEAEQREPIQRKVALKMVRRGMDTEEFVARFESERQALAMMDHPCIATVYDAGATENGRPFFVMEYVEGVPLNQYCDDHSLSISQRLEIFILVCEGVQHAHQKAIIHRDLKPSNVLVTIVDNHPVPKIIDFGVAKATDRSLFGSTQTTSVGQIIGTPEYMSPEQAEMSEAGIDTRTDVYALGVMLYELLVGHLPFTSEELSGLSIPEVLRKIREDDPPRPSARASTLTEAAANRRTDPGGLKRHLKGDLDWISMKALEKDRARRYETANALAVDLRRHLGHEPVNAGPPSGVYRLGKFVRRHRTGVAAGVLVLVAIMLGITGTTVSLIRAKKAEKLAEERAETAKQVSDFLVDIFEVSDPDRARGTTITAREILEEGARRIEAELEDQPLTQASLMNSIGKVYQGLGLFPEATVQLEAARNIYEINQGQDESTHATILSNLASLYIDQARYSEAEDLLDRAMEFLDLSKVPDRLQLAGSISKLASVYRREGRYEEAGPLYEKARDLRIASLGRDHPEVAASYNSLAALNWNTGHFEQAESLFRQALAIWEKAYGSDHSDVAKGLNNLAILYHHLDRYSEAVPLYERAVSIYERILGPMHPRTGNAINNLALVHYDQGEFALAVDLYQRALEIRESALDPDHPDVAQTLNNLGNLFRDQGRYDEAEEHLLRALDIRGKALGQDHPDVAWSRRDLGRLELLRGNPAAAMLHFRLATEIFTAAHGDEHPDLPEFLNDRVEACNLLGRDAEADSLARWASRIQEANSPQR